MAVEKLIVLTGASGFVGRQVLRELTRRGRRVTVIARNRGQLDLGSASNLVKVEESKDLFDESPDRLVTILENVDTLIHAAWYAEPGVYQSSPRNLNCLVGTLRLAQAFAAIKGNRFIGLGTCAEYDFSKNLLTIESSLKPHTLYAACKVSAFQVLNEFFSNGKIGFAWCRLFYLYGEGEDERRLVAYIRKQLSAGKPARLGTGTPILDFIDVRRAAELIVDVALGNVQGPVNISTGESVSVRQLAEQIADEYGRRDLLHFSALPTNRVDQSCIVGVPGPFNA